MFEYKKKWDYYWITSYKIKGEFWPFVWIFCRNKYLNSPLVPLFVGEGNLKELEKKYPWYKYSFWIYNNTIFIIWKEWIENILSPYL